MNVQRINNLKPVALGHIKNLGHFIAIPAIILLLIAFFLPWITVLNQDKVLGQTTGVKIAQGVEDKSIQTAGNAFDTAPSLYLWIIPVVAVIALAATGTALSTRKVIGFILGIYVVTAILGLGVVGAKFVQIQSDFTHANADGRSTISFGYDIGWWLTVAASLFMLVAAFLVFQAESQIRDHPTTVRVTRVMRLNGLQIGILGVMFVLWFAFIVGSPETFLNKQIYRALMTAIPYWGIIALPLTMVVIAGEIDLSFPSTMAVGMVAFFEVYTRQESLELAFVGALAAGFLVGLINGLIIVRLGIPSLIATIGTQFFWRGVVEVIRAGQGESMVFTRDTALRNTLVSKVNDYFPAQVLWMILVGAIVWVLLNRHKFGAHVYLIGDNEDSARLMGVNVNLTRVMLFALVGVAAAFAGIIQSLDNWYFWPNIGEGYLMQTLAAVFLGGTSVYGGTGSVFGTFIACFIIGGIQPGIVAVGLTGYYTKLIYGMIITASVAMHSWLRRRLQ
jgi:simple sugar transport system permease protein